MIQIGYTKNQPFDDVHVQRLFNDVWVSLYALNSRTNETAFTEAEDLARDLK